ncbi:DUF6691 family protein [Methylobacillus pratensis]
MPLITALVAGFLFGLGLIVSGMVNPQKVLAFLDIAGRWDPSLAFVMLGAIPVAAVGFFRMRLCHRTFLDQEVQIPETGLIDARLLIGAGLFGIGWGIVGYCPGPALAGVGAGSASAVVFVGAMVVGMCFYRFLDSLFPGK